MPRRQLGRTENSPRANLLLPTLGLLLLLALCAALVRLLPQITRNFRESLAAPTSVSAPSVTEAVLAQAEIPERDPLELGQRLGAAPAVCTLPAPGPFLDSAACGENERMSWSDDAVGDREAFWVLELASATSFPVSATLQHVSQHLNMWVQDGIELDRQALQRSAAVFAEIVYPTIHRYFGSEWSPGIDGDERLHVLHAHFGGAAGYFFSQDEYPSTIVPYSNEREMFYINPEYEQPGTDGYDSTLAHEFQHMVHWFADRNEDAWVNEGASELAMHACGYSRQDRIAAFARQPDVPLTHWESERVSEHYAASFLFMAYFLERYGADAVQELVANPLNGIAGFESTLRAQQANLSFDQLFADWISANYLDSQMAEMRSSRYAYEQLDIRVEPEHVVSSYPTQESGEVHQYAADYIELVAAGHDLQLKFGGVATTTLIPNQPHSGHYQWWSNRGDNSNMTLTRSFDLTKLTEATLRAWLWYDIEDGWDYAYAEVSTDGGATWHILQGTQARTAHLGGNAYGPGYSGFSGAEERSSAGAGWVEERYDLSSYGGQPVLVRFEYVTDEAVNGPGLCIDDIRIPELGYWHDAESGDDGWVAQGFVRCDNIVPQRYIVQLLRIPAQTSGAATRCSPLDSEKAGVDCAAASEDRITIQQLHLADDQSGTWLLSGGKAASKAVLIVSAASSARGIVAPYRYEVRAAK
jgi:immune inhibitor A